MAIPKIIIDKHKGHKGLRYFLVLAYLQKNKTLLDKVNLTIDNLVIECGYTPDNHPNKTNDDFKSILKQLIDSEQIHTDVNIDKIRSNQFFTLDIDRNLFHCDKNFVLVNIEEFDKIINNKTKASKSVVWGIYIYIKQWIPLDDIQAKVAYPSKYGMQKKLGISSNTTVKKAVQDLVDLGMLYEYSERYYENSDGEFEPTNNVFALEENELKYAEQTLCSYYKVDRTYKKGEFDKDKLKYPERN